MPEDRTFFGHPRGLAYLLGAEAGGAFAYFGLQTTLTLYMTQTLLLPGHVEHVLGFGMYRTALLSLFGPLTATGVASQTFGLAMGLVYAFAILGGLVADRWIGQRKAVIAGSLVLTFAYVLLIAEQTFLISLVLMVVGTGLLKTSLIGQIGRLYTPDDDRRSRAFGLYLIAVNLGSVATPLICGTLGERLGWSYGFAVMAVGMALGGLCYLAGLRHMPPDITVSVSGGVAKAPNLQKGQGRIVLALLVVMLLNGLWSGVYNQAFNIFPIWADAHVQRQVFGFLVPVTWFSTLDGLLTIGGTALAVRIWTRQTVAGNTNDIRRLLVGFALATAAFLVLTFGAFLGGPGKAPLIAELGFFVLVDLSVPWINTVVMTMISRDAPSAISSTMLGLFYLFVASGSLLTGWLGEFADRMTMSSFWLLHAGLDAGALLLLLLAGAKLSQLLTAKKLTPSAMISNDA